MDLPLGFLAGLTCMQQRLGEQGDTRNDRNDDCAAVALQIAQFDSILALQMRCGHEGLTAGGTTQQIEGSAMHAYDLAM